MISVYASAHSPTEINLRKLGLNFLLFGLVVSLKSHIIDYYNSNSSEDQTSTSCWYKYKTTSNT